MELETEAPAGEDPGGLVSPFSLWCVVVVVISPDPSAGGGGVVGGGIKGRCLPALLGWLQDIPAVDPGNWYVK